MSGLDDAVGGFITWASCSSSCGLLLRRLKPALSARAGHRLGPGLRALEIIWELMNRRTRARSTKRRGFFLESTAFDPTAPGMLYVQLLSLRALCSKPGATADAIPAMRAWLINLRASGHADAHANLGSRAGARRGIWMRPQTGVLEIAVFIDPRHTNARRNLASGHREMIAGPIVECRARSGETSRPAPHDC